MRVGFIAPWGIECGIATYTEHLAARLAELGHEVLVLAEHGENRGDDPEATSGIDIVRCWRRGSGDDSESLAALDGLDVLHVQHEFGLCSDPGRWDALLSEASRKVPCVVTPHTLFQRGSGDAWFRQALAEHAAAVVAHTPAMRDDLVACNVPADRVHHISHGTLIDRRIRKGAARAALGLPQKPVIAMTLGFISCTKPVHEVVAVIAAMRDEGKLADGGFIYLVGGTPGGGHPANVEYMQQVGSAISRLGLREMVWIVNRYIAEDDLPYWYGAADFAINHSAPSALSTSGRAHREMGFGVPAMASRQPILDDYQGIADVYTNGHEMRACLERMISEPARWAELGAKAKAFGKATSWPNVARQHVEVYDRVIR